MKQSILYFLIACLFAGYFMSCGSKSEEKQSENKADSTETTKEEKKKAEEPAGVAALDKPNGAIYRCDGFLPSVASEWMQVAYNEEKDKIVGIWYWNTADDKKIKLNLIEATFSKGEIGGITGKLSFPENPETIGFGMIEDKFNLSFADGRFQEFEYEETEY